MKYEIENDSQLALWLAAPCPAVFQAMDLSAAPDELSNADLRDCAFLGCLLSVPLTQAAARHNCMVLPRVDGQPFDPYSATLYSPAELYRFYDPNSPSSYSDCPDRLIYLSYADANGKPKEVSADLMLLRRMHDATTTEALEDLMANRTLKTVAIMGGHDQRRNTTAYAQVATLTLLLTQAGYFIATGGGPGLMEAANLGAYCAGFKQAETVLADALKKLRAADDLNVGNKIDWLDWLKTGYVVWQEMGKPENAELSRSVGIPTWFYGHEPPNVFATDIAKYFENSIREEGLLALAWAGVVFGEGNGGTVQEIFQDCCQNFYWNTDKPKSPMILFGVDYWNPIKTDFDDPKNLQKPVYPLLRKMASLREFDDYLCLTDEIDLVVDFIKTHPPKYRA